MSVFYFAQCRIWGGIEFASLVVNIPPLFGDPLDLDVRVERLYRATDEPIASWPGEMTPCDIVVVRSGETELLLSSKRVPWYWYQILCRFRH